jgi:O-antigen/teichoic acid export membrane protein
MHVPVASSMLRRIRADLRDPLLRNGYALVANVGITSVLGFVYWIIAARLYPPEHLGLGNATIALMQLLAGIAGQPSIANALTRFIPRAGDRSRRLAAVSYGIAGVVGLIVSGLYVAATHLPLGLPELLGGGWAFGVILAVSVTTWCVFSLQDAVLTGIRQAVWLPLENGIYGVAKIGLLIALASVAVQYGIVASWIVPAILIVVPVNLFIFCVLLPRHARSSRAEPGGQSARSIARFVGGDYLGSVFALATVDLLPLLVVARLGAVDTGYFSIPFLIIYSLELVTVNLGVALTVEGAMDRSELRRHVLMVVRRMGLLVLPAVAVLLAVPGLVLSLFGAAYADNSSTLLRLLAVGVIAKAVTTLYLSLARVERKVSRIAVIEAVRLVLLLGSAWWLMGEFGLAGIGIAYLATQSVVAVVLVPGIVRITRAPVRSSQPAA